MTQPQDAPLLAALESQCRQLDDVLARLEAARVAYLPAPAPSWRGAARHAYGVAIGALAAASDAGCAAVREARDHTAWAVTEVTYRG